MIDFRTENCSETGCYIRLKFQIDNKLRLNFTFNKLRILTDCHVQRNDVFVVTSVTSNTTTTLSNFLVYPPSTYVKILFTHRITTVHISMSVIAAGIIENLKFTQNRSIGMYFSSYGIMAIKTFIYLYKLQVEKHLGIELKTTSIFSFPYLE